MATRAAKSFKRKAPALVYDLEAHREFVTGFRRRKQARRQQAAATAATADKQARRDARKEKREILRAATERGVGLSDGEDEDEVHGGMQTTYQTDDTVVTAVVAPMEIGRGGLGFLRKPGQGREQKGDANDSKQQEGSGGGIGTAISRLRKGTQSSGRKWKKSYTHALSKSHKRKAKIRNRKAAAKQ